MAKRNALKQLGRQAAKACGARWRRRIVHWYEYIESVAGLRSWIRRKCVYNVSPGVRLYRELVRIDDGGADEFWAEVCWDVCPIKLEDDQRPRVLMEACRDSHDFVIAFVEELVAKEHRLKNKTL